MHIVYAVTTCSDKVYRQLFSKTKIKPGFQSQKYHRLLIEGLAGGCKVDVVANPPLNRSVMEKPWISLPEETEGGANYRYIPAIRNPIIKLIFVIFGTFFKTLTLARRDSAVVVDCLNRGAALSAMAAARLRGRPCVGIVTDLPDMLGGSAFSKKIANFVISRCTHYVLLTDAMNDYLNHGKKPYVVLEGHADITMKEKIPSMAKKGGRRICLYAGGVSRQYGLADLTAGFQIANVPEAELHIYGPGDYVEELKKIAAEDSRVFYGGMLLSGEIVEKEQGATLLVNPRPTGEEYVKYSFPSKTMEYISSGTPVLTTRLPGMPKEYAPHVYFIDEETPDGIARALIEVLGHTDEELFEKGEIARNFVLDSRNNVVQGAKILDMLKK